MTALLSTVAARLDDLLGVQGFPDYPNAINGLQCENRGTIRAVAAAVDVSADTIRTAGELEATLLLVHHGLFWGGLQPLVGFRLARVRQLLERDVALYSAHLPLDAHPTLGNSRLLAAELGLPPTSGFAMVHGNACGVRGECDRSTADLVAACDAFARTHGGSARSSVVLDGRRTRRWAICSGAGAGTETLAEATAANVDTLIVGEGPHWTAVDAPERDLVIIYAGHYATETLGVRALGAMIAGEFQLPFRFIPSPTGL